MANKLDHAHYSKNPYFVKNSFRCIFQQFSEFDEFCELDNLSKCRKIDEFVNLAIFLISTNFVNLIFDDFS